MKRVLFSILIALLGLNVFAQEYFVGDMVSKTETQNQTDIDAIVVLAKQKIDENSSLDPMAAAMAKSMVKNIVINQVKQQELLQYVLTLPNGTYTQVIKFDGKNNRTVSFCPELGRIIVRDYNKGLVFVAFPKLKLACQEVEYMHRSKEMQLMALKGQLPGLTPEMVNGELCVPYYSYQEYEKVGGEKTDTITINNILYKKGESYGWAYASYPFMPYDVTITTEYGYSKLQNLELTEKEIDDANFVLPQDYKVSDSLAKFAKKVSAALKKQDASIPFDGNIPDNLWSLVP